MSGQSRKMQQVLSRRSEGAISTQRSKPQVSVSSPRDIPTTEPKQSEFSSRHIITNQKKTEFQLKYRTYKVSVLTLTSIATGDAGLPIPFPRSSSMASKKKNLKTTPAKANKAPKADKPGGAAKTPARDKPLSALDAAARV